MARRERDLATPYIHEPEEKVSELMCWKDQDRPCGTDCVAFNTAELDEHGQPIAGPNMCTLIAVDLARNDKLHTIVQLLQKSNKKMPYDMPEAPRL